MGALFSWQISALLLTHLGEAVAAVNGTVRLGLERNLSLTTTGSAHRGKILTGAASSVLAGITAGLAALGLVLEAALGIELLLTSGEGELVATLFSYQDLVFVHGLSLSLTRCPNQFAWAIVICDQLTLDTPGIKSPRHFAANALDGVVYRLLGAVYLLCNLSTGEAV